MQRPASKAEDRRTFPRRKVKIGCRWSNGESAPPVNATIADISGGGMALVFNGPLPEEVTVETAILKRPIKVKLKRRGDCRVVSRQDGVAGLQYGLEIVAMAKDDWEHLRRVSVDKEVSAVVGPAKAVAAPAEDRASAEDKRLKDMIPVAVQQQIILKLAILKRLDRPGLDQTPFVTYSCSGKWMSDVTLDVASRTAKGKAHRSVFTYNVESKELTFVR